MLTEIDVDANPNAFVRRDTIALVVNGQTQEVEFSTDGWETAIREWKRKHPFPKPPFREEIMRPGTPEARRYGITKGIATRKIYDERDAGYLAEVEEWNDKGNYIVAAHCLKLTLKRGGEPVEDLEERAELLSSLGLTTYHAAQLYQLVMECSRLEEKEAVDFTEEPSGPTNGSEP